MKLEDLNLTEEEMDDLQEELNSRKKKQAYKKNIEAIENNRKYVGKCYFDKKENKYIMVLSSKSSNEYRLESMVFSFPIKVKENHRFTKVFSPDNAFSTISYNGIHVESYPLLCSSFTSRGTVLKSLEEITKEEYYSKMDEYISDLKKTIKNKQFETNKKETYDI